MDIRTRLLEVVSLSTRYCASVEQAREMENEEFVKDMTDILPRLYLAFCNLTPEDVVVSDYGYYSEYVDEPLYNSVRRNIEVLLGEDDVFLETFEEDMKYSDTPIAVSISECLADIFQALYNFISVVNDSNADEMEGAYLECREKFESYWSQTLCNVMRALNNIRFR